MGCGGSLTAMATRPHRKPYAGLTEAEKARIDALAAAEFARNSPPPPAPAQLAIICDPYIGPTLHRHLAARRENAT